MIPAVTQRVNEGRELGVAANFPPWDEICERILGRPGLVLVIGATDTGKTTFVTYLVRRACARGVATAVVDADIGQSEIGPPTCVSLGFVTDCVEQLSQVQAATSGFVGSISPEWALLDHLTQTCAMAARARESGVPLMVVDTTGFAPLPWCESLKRAKLDALKPDYVVALERRESTSPLYRTLRGLEKPFVSFAPVPEWVATKPPEMRAQRRAWRISRAMASGTVRAWPLEELILENTWLGSGQRLTRAALKQLSAETHTEVVYAELIGRRLGIVLRRDGEHEVLRAATERLYGTGTVMVIRTSVLDGLLVGLHDAARNFLGLGLLAGIDFAAYRIRILTSIATPSAVRMARLGYLRCNPQGQVLGVVRPREL